jgi:diazepam-binding inhibitor (GABA receptor modulating acyl-CoA-binding protein)
MSDLTAEFERVAKAVQDQAGAFTGLPDDKKLEIYALFKQGSVGDVNTDRPGMLDFKGKAKWDAWNAKKGMDQDEAKRQYIELVSAFLS